VRRKVLVIEDESSIRNLIYVLLSALQCEGEFACSGQQALSMIARESFDAVLLDLRSSELPPGEIAREICEIRPSLVGRILFITGSVRDRQTLDFIERSCMTPAQRGRLVRDVWERLRLLLGPAEPSSAR
jgi:CheY-like chemotaxis protein